MSLNRDAWVAIALLLIAGGLMVASFDIREPDYGQLSPAAWPRVILGAILAMGVIYLIQSLRSGADEPAPDGPKGARAFVAHWRNVLWVFALFLGYLLALPYIGMLIGAMAFVFLLLTALGGIGRTPIHLALALVSVGGMWALFTYALGVLLPTGSLTGI
ncbi:MAG: tripartite tricarboxylate transporter TctB family protein [Pseudomonadota bacterium]